MEPYYSSDSVAIFHADCREVLPLLEGVDAVVTDPPYELGFMGKAWDRSGVSFSAETWRLVLGAMKPGAALLSFGGTRTFHRIAVAIEDGGFEIRDTLCWLYGTGFPKSLDVSKAIDKAGLSNPQHLTHRQTLAREIRTKREAAQVTREELASWFPYKEVTKNWERIDAGFRIPTEADYQVLVDRLCLDKKWRSMVRAEDNRLKREGMKVDRRGDGTVYDLAHNGCEYTATTDAARQWDGWGTALKPAYEPIILARRPLSERTVAANVLRHGTGGINVGGCRIPGQPAATLFDPTKHNHEGWRMTATGADAAARVETVGGRFPANVLLDEEAAAMLDAQTGNRGASRFFYCAKASSRERGEGNHHPTVKPLALMRYLCRLITPPNGIILDPFMGSGSTLLAAQQEGFVCIGIELDEENCELAARRLDNVEKMF